MQTRNDSGGVITRDTRCLIEDVWGTCFVLSQLSLSDFRVARATESSVGGDSFDADNSSHLPLPAHFPSTRPLTPPIPFAGRC